VATTIERSAQQAAIRTPRITLRHISFLLVAVGLFITGYLTYMKLTNQSMVCLQGGMWNCAAVENSPWATFQGIPVATLGLFAHAAIGALLLLEPRVALFRQNGALMILGIALFGVMYHAYLIYVSFFILQALCVWCLAAATTMFLQLIVTSLRVRNVLRAA
jgi:uncharacterized membrane protein